MASLGSLIAGIAHEINNPLAFVSSNLNRFSEYFSDLFNLVDKWKGFGNNIIDEGNYATAIEEIIKHEKEIDYGFIKNDCTELMKHNFEGIERIKKIVQQLRGFTHASDDNAIEADINNAIEETLTIVWNELKYKTDVKKYYGNIPPVQCHISEIKQIFVNLLVNASHAIETRGEITIETLKEDKNVVIKISDTGKGMSAATKRKIFDPFFTTKAVGEGTGLGLWICMSLVQKHHGNIEVKSKEGSGTTFTITLPIEAKQENDQ
jgi:signal transduction histidine kinase